MKKQLFPITRCSSFALKCCVILSLLQISFCEEFASHRQQHRRNIQNNQNLYDFCFSQNQDKIDPKCDEFDYELKKDRAPAHCEPIVAYYRENTVDNKLSAKETQKSLHDFVELTLNSDPVYNVCFTWIATFETVTPSSQQAPNKLQSSTKLKLSPFDPPKECKNKKKKQKHKKKEICDEWKQLYPNIPEKPKDCYSVSCDNTDYYDDAWYDDCKAWCAEVQEILDSATPSIVHTSSPSIAHTLSPSTTHTSSPSIADTSSPSTTHTSPPSIADTSPPTITHVAGVKQPGSFSSPFELDFSDIQDLLPVLLTEGPTRSPSKFPTESPTKTPTQKPTKSPTEPPTVKQSEKPIDKPSQELVPSEPNIEENVNPEEQSFPKLLDGPITTFKLPFFHFDITLDPATTGKIDDSKLFAIFELYLENHYKMRFNNPKVAYFASVMRRSLTYDHTPNLYKHQFTGTLAFLTANEGSLPRSDDIIQETIFAFDGYEFLNSLHNSNDKVLASTTSVSVLEENQQHYTETDVNENHPPLGSSKDDTGAIIGSAFALVAVLVVTAMVFYRKWVEHRRQSYFDEGRDVLHSEIKDNTFEMEDGEDSGYYRTGLDIDEQLFPVFA